MKTRVIIAAITLAGLLAWFPGMPQTAPAGEKIVKMTVSGCTT